MRRSFIVTVLLLCALLGSCARAQTPCCDILNGIMYSRDDLPEGKIYISGEEEASEHYLSPQLMRTMYGEDAEELFGLLEEYAIYISSFASPCEIAIFKCYSSSDAHRIDTMCRSRIDDLRVALHATEFEELCNSAITETYGRYVIMTISKDANAIGEEATRQFD